MLAKNDSVVNKNTLLFLHLKGIIFNNCIFYVVRLIMKFLHSCKYYVRFMLVYVCFGFLFLWAFFR